MAFQEIKTGALSDLVFHEVDPASGYARRVVEISDTDTEIPMGTVVFRSASAAAGAPFAVAEVGDLHEDGVAADVELAVVFGDRYGCKGVFTTGASGNTGAVAFVRGEVQLKDYLIMEALGITDRGSDDYLALKEILERQGVIIERTMGV